MYTNKALGLSILAPGGWAFFPHDRNQELVVKNRTGARNPEAAQTQVLFQAAPSKLLGEEKSAIFSAGVQVLTEKTTPRQYAMDNRDRLASQKDVVLTRDVTDARFANITLTTFEITGKAKGVSYRQAYWVTIRKGLAIFFVETFYDNKNTFATEASLKTLKFGK